MGLKFLFLVSLLGTAITWTAGQALTGGEVDTGLVDDDDVIIGKWQSMIEGSYKQLDSMLKSMLPSAIRLTSSANLTVECQSAFLKFIVDLRKLEDWAFKMIDASGKIPSGITVGTIHDLGDFDLCLSIKNREFSTHYCPMLITAVVPKVKPLDFSNFTKSPNSFFNSFQDKIPKLTATAARLGLCVPSVCTKNDMQNIMSTAFRDLPLNVRIPACIGKEPNRFTWDQLLVISALALLGVILVAGTICDLYDTKRKCWPSKILVHFSLYSNGKRLLTTGVKTQRLKALNGIKLIAMAWILLDHTYSYATRFSLKRTLNLLDFLKDPMFAVLWNGFVAVDVFFTISGFLLTYLTLSHLDKTGGKLNIAGFYIRRFWRLMPSMLLIVGVLLLFPLFGSGPLFEEAVQREVDVCRRNWWSVIFFVNGWLDYFDMCLVHTWFISNDIHFYIISPLFLIALYKKPSLGIFMCLATILISTVILASLTVIYGLNVILPVTLEDFYTFKDLLQYNYFKPYAHLSPYFIGVLLGFIFYRTPEIKMNKFFVLLGWCLSAVLAMVTLISVYDWEGPNKPTIAIAATYQSLHRISWALSISWVIFASCYGYGGFLTTFLSWGGFVPLNRLLYMIYLIQLPVIWLRIGTTKHIVPYDHIEMIYQFFANIVLITGLSAIAYLAVEAPFSSLDIAIFGKITPRRFSKRVSIKVNKGTESEADGNNPKLQGLPNILDPRSEKGQVENGGPIESYKSLSLNDNYPVELTTSMVTTFAPETEPMSESEARSARLMELKTLYGAQQ